MMQNLYFLDVFVNIDTYEVAPYICNHDNGKQIGHTLLDPDVRIFNIKAAALHTFEHRLNPPSLLVHFKRFLCIAIRNKDLKFRLSVLVLDFRPRQVARLPVDIIDTCKMFALTKFQISEEPVCFGLFTVPDDTEVFAYPDMVVYASGVQKSEPLASDKLSVSHQVSDAVLACKRDAPLNEFRSLFCVGVATLVHHLEDYRKGHAFVDDTESKYVDVSAAELPVCPVHGQGVRPLCRYEF